MCRYFFFPAALLLASTLCFASPTGELVYEKAPFPSCHAATIVEVAQNQFLAAWFGGTDEGANDVAIWGSHKVGDKWSVPFEIVREPQVPTWNPVLFTTKDGVLWLYYKVGKSPSQWTGARLSSRDGGKTWSKPEHLPAGLYGPIKNKPLLLQDGTIVSGTSVESYRAWASWVERSRDNGKNWTKHGPVVYPGEPFGTIQPTIVPIKGKGLRMFVRTTKRIGKIAYADSTDGGVTWSELKPTALPNPDSGIDAVGLADGRIILIYNHTEKGRTPLNVAVSSDGESWNNFLALETNPGEYSYPAVIQARNGNLHFAYTFNRKQIKHVEIPLSDVPK
jgi:predicted neuraminidase